MPLVINGVTLDAEDLREPSPQWPSLQRLERFRQLLAIGGPLLAVVVAGSTVTSLTDFTFAIGAFWILAGSWVLARLISRRQNRWKRELVLQSTLESAPVEWSISDAGVRQTSESITSEFPWTSVVEAVESLRSFTFVLSPYVNIRLPKRYCDAPAIERIRALILQAWERGDIQGFPDRRP